LSKRSRFCKSCKSCSFGLSPAEAILSQRLWHDYAADPGLHLLRRISSSGVDLQQLEQESHGSLSGWGKGALLLRHNGNRLRPSSFLCVRWYSRIEIACDRFNDRPLALLTIALESAQLHWSHEAAARNASRACVFAPAIASGIDAGGSWTATLYALRTSDRRFEHPDMTMTRLDAALGNFGA